MRPGPSHRPQTKLRKGIVLNLSVILFTGGGGVSQHSLGHTLPPGRTPPRQKPPWADTSLPSACWDTHPSAQCMLGYTTPACPVHAEIHNPPPPPAMAIAADGTHPTGMHTCLTKFSECNFRGRNLLRQFYLYHLPLWEQFNQGFAPEYSSNH